MSDSSDSDAGPSSPKKMRLEPAKIEFKGYPCIKAANKSQVILGTKYPKLILPGGKPMTGSQVAHQCNDVITRLNQLATECDEIEQELEVNRNPLTLAKRLSFYVPDNPYQRRNGPNVLDVIHWTVGKCLDDLDDDHEGRGVPDSKVHTYHYTTRWEENLKKLRCELQLLCTLLAHSLARNLGHDIHQVMLDNQLDPPTDRMLDWAAAAAVFLRAKVLVFEQNVHRSIPTPK